MFRTLPILAAFALGFSPSSTAQDTLSVDSIQYGGRFDVATRTFHPSALDPDEAQFEAAGSQVLFNNSTTNGSLTTGGGTIMTTHFMDWGTANFGGGGATISQFRIAYATNVLAPTAVNLRIRLYQGATGNGNSGTVIFDSVVGPLPNSASGGFEGFFIDVTPVTPINMADGAIGWSYNADTANTGPLTIGPPNETGVVNFFDRYAESTGNYIDTVSFAGGVPFASFCLRLTGRLNTPPPTAWENYGTKKVVDLTGDGPGEADTANEITIKSTVPGKPVFMVIGIVESAQFQANLDIWFWALPWLVQTGTFIPNPANASVSIPFTMPSVVNPGEEIFFQAFGQNLAGNWKNYSKGLKLTIQ